VANTRRLTTLTFSATNWGLQKNYALQLILCDELYMQSQFKLVRFKDSDEQDSCIKHASWHQLI